MFRKITAAALSVQLLIACSESIQKIEPSDSTQKKESKAVVPEPSFTGVVFESKKDLVCGMPVTAGISDTVHFKGKIYGFCAVECKDEFVKDPGLYIAGGK